MSDDPITYGLRPDSGRAPHRGQMILVLGIVSLFVGGLGLILGPMAWIMGRKDLAAMDCGKMDEAGRSNTNTGRICGMIGTLLHGASLVCCVGYFGFMGALFTTVIGGAAKSQAQRVQMAQAEMQAAKEAAEARQQAIRDAAEKAAREKQPATPPKDRTPKADPAPKTDPAPAPEPAVKGTVDLLAHIDPVRDTIKGKWSFAGKFLKCDDQHFGPRVQIRYEPPEEYDFVIQWSQPQLRHAITAMMPNKNAGSFLWKVGVQDGNDFELMSTKRQVGKAPGLIRANTTHSTAVQVRRNRIRCLVDNREILLRTTDFKDLTIDSWNKMPNPQYLGVGCDDPTTFYYIRVIEISGPGKKR